MNYQNIETFRGLIKPSDINDFNFLKKSCSSKFFESATQFIKVILKIKIDTENHIESEYFELLTFEHMTAYVRSDVILEAKDKLKVTHKLYLSNSIDSKDDEILSKQNLILISQNIHQSMKIDINKSDGIYSAFKDLVRIEDCDEMSHMNVQYYFGKHSDAIKLTASLKKKLIIKF